MTYRATLSFEPLAEVMPRPMCGWCGEGIRPLFQGDEATYRAYYRARNNGRITPDMADRIAFLLGKHPSEIWGPEWDA